MAQPELVQPEDCGTWPRRLRYLLDSIACIWMQSYQLVRGRAAGSPSSTIRLMAERDDALWHAAFLEREVAVFRRRIGAMNPHKRPPLQPQDRFEILQIIRLRGWSLKTAAKRFVVHYNSLGAWRREFLGGKDVGRFFGPAPFNKLGDTARWLVHEVRRMCPHLATGTRTIANMIVQTGVQVSRSTVQRVLREKKPRRPARTALPPEGRKPYGLLTPKRINRTWHLDLSAVRTLVRRFYVAAIVDGFSRKLLVLKVYARTPTTRMMTALVRQARAIYGPPRFLASDQGCQFRDRFTTAVENGMGIKHVKARVRGWAFNGKVERFFRTLKLWARCVLWAWAPSRRAMARKIQRRLDVFRDWYNLHRPHQAIGGRTPEQVWTGAELPAPVTVRAHEAQPGIEIVKHRYGDDPRLPVLELEIDWPEAA